MVRAYHAQPLRARARSSWISSSSSAITWRRSLYEMVRPETRAIARPTKNIGMVMRSRVRAAHAEREGEVAAMILHVRRRPIWLPRIARDDAAHMNGREIRKFLVAHKYFVSKRAEPRRKRINVWLRQVASVAKSKTPTEVWK
jgi:hypothetical protein